MTDIRLASVGATFCNGRQVAEVSEEVTPGVDRVTIYLVRHCQSTGQAPDAPLTDLGRQQARRLADALDELGIERIVSSPYARARQSVEPLAARLGLEIETDDRLVERVLSHADLPDWRDRMRASFDDLDLCLPGGESGRVATRRGADALDAVFEGGRLPAVVVAHGNLIALLLHSFDARPGFETWAALSNPDVFRLARTTPAAWTVQRTWTPE